MANVTATSITGPDDVLTNIRDFINVTLTGWTLHVNLAAPPTGEDTAGGRELIASKGDVLFGLRSTTSGTSNGNLFLFDGNGAYSAMDNIDEMTGNSGIRVTDAQYDDTTVAARFWNEVNPGTWPNIWLFGDNSPSHWYLVAEIATGVFRHMWVGELSPKIGTWTGGAFYAAQFWGQGSTTIDQPDNTGHSCPFDAPTTIPDARCTTLHCETLTPTSDWVQISDTVNPTLNSVQRAAGVGCGMRGNLGQPDWFNTGVSSLSGISYLTPIGCYYRDLTDNPDSFHHLGFAPNVKMINIESLDPAQTIVIGSDTYRVFPLAAKNGANAAYNSGVYGIAYRVF